MGRTVKVFGSAPYLGQDQEVHLEVRFGERTEVNVSAKFDGMSPIDVRVELTGREGAYSLNSECLDQLRALYNQVQFEEPTGLLLATWEKVLNDLWRCVLVESENATVRLDRHELVRAVGALQQARGGELVSAVEVMKWCDAQVPRLDYGNTEHPTNNFLWEADLDERRCEKRLLKFKTSAVKQGRVYFGLASRAASARAEARRQGWVEVPWDPQALGGLGNWTWEDAEVP